MKRRVNRLAGEIRDEVARMMASDLKDPRVGFVTVTRVDLTDDLRYARVYVGVLGEDDKGPTMEASAECGGLRAPGDRAPPSGAVLPGDRFSI